MKGVQVYHCLLREQELAEVQQAGLRNFIYWYNGNRDYEACVPERAARAGALGRASPSWPSGGTGTAGMPARGRRAARRTPTTPSAACRR